ncbi:MAG: hypothetical protein ACKOYM_00075, partial [Actinomycetes bacterium]
NQVLAIFAAAGLVLATLPVAFASTDGRWYQPEGDYGRLLRTVDRGDDFRALWIGDPDVLPVAGWALGGSTGLSVGVTEGLTPLVTQRFRLNGGAGVRQLRAAVDAALNGGTDRLGQLLAPMGVRYVVVVDRPAPEPFAEREVPLPSGALAALREQLDLLEVPTNPAVALFRNPLAWPLRSDVGPLNLPKGGVPTLRGQLALPPTTPPAALGRGPSTDVTGPIPAGAQIAQSVTGDPNWSLQVNGESASRSDLFGWAQRFSPPRAASRVTATLAWSTPAIARLLQLLQVAVLVALLVVAFGGGRMVPRGRRQADPDAPVLVVEEPADMAPLGDGRGRGAAEGSS